MQDRQGNPVEQPWRQVSDAGVNIYPAQTPGRSTNRVEVFIAEGFGSIAEWHVRPRVKLEHGHIWRLPSDQPSVDLRRRADRVRRDWEAS